MKYFAVVAVVALIAAAYAADPINLSDEQRRVVREAAAFCLQREQVPESAAQNLRAGNFAGADQKTKCFVNCFLEKLGFVQGGVPQDSVIREKLGAIVGADKIGAIIEQCNGLRGAEKCDTSFKLYECYFKKNAGII